MEKRKGKWGGTNKNKKEGEISCRFSKTFGVQKHYTIYMTDEAKFSYNNGCLKEEELGHKLKNVFRLFFFFFF